MGGALLDGFRESEDEDAPRPVQHACYMLKTAFRTVRYAAFVLIDVFCRARRIMQRVHCLCAANRQFVKVSGFLCAAR